MSCKRHGIYLVNGAINTCCYYVPDPMTSGGTTKGAKQYDLTDCMHANHTPHHPIRKVPIGNSNQVSG